MHPIDTKQRPQLYKMNFLKLMSIFFFDHMLVAFKIGYQEILLPGMFFGFGILGHFGLKNCSDYLTKTTLSLYLLNCFKYFLIYILGQNVSKKQTRKIFELYQAFVHNFLRKNDKMFITIFELYQAWQNVSILLLRIKSITH